MQFRQILIGFLFLLMPLVASAQTYNSTTITRPSGLDWQEIKTEHFRIIFPDGRDSLAYRSAAILEDQYAKASELTGGTLKNFPIILRDYNDLSNGFVNSFNFRSEVDLSALKGKSMNPKTGDWLETVLSHELVHAAHFNVQQPFSEKKFSLTNVISLLSPDWARSFHGFPPVGMHEGLAVYHETESIAPMGGRGNYAHFNNRFNANFGSSDRWNMGQTFITSDYSLPLNRHYISGYQFTDWLHDEYGDDISRKAIRYHYHNFFLGYGFALRQKTGEWPWQLYSNYEKAQEEREAERLESIGKGTTEKSNILDFHFKGEEVRAPKWISNDELLFYASFYNARLGFYKYHLNEKKPTLFTETYSVADFNYEIEDGKKFYFSSYKTDPLYPSIYKTDVFQYDLEEEKSQRLTQKARVYAPTSNGERLLGVRTEAGVSEIVEVHEETGEVCTLITFTEATPRALRFNPKNPEQLAVVMQKRGVQALWLTTLETLHSDLQKAPEIAFENGSVFDPEWHPSGKKILFTVDVQPAMNIYEYDLETGEILQLTNAAYNAMEASYSPEGDKIAYVLQVVNERKVAILERSDFLNEWVSEGDLYSGQKLKEALNRPLLGAGRMDSLSSLEATSYKGNLRWLKPRMMYPVFEEKSGSYQYGFGFSSIDALSSQAYSVELTGIQNRLWYDLTYTNKMFYPGAELSVYSDPQFFVAANQDGERFSLMRQDRGVSLSLPFEYRFRGDTRLSSMSFSPEVKAEQFKYYNLQPEAITDFNTRYRAGMFSQLNVGVLTLPRDVQPSAGISVFGLYEQTLNELEFEIPTPIGTLPRQLDNQWSAYYGVFGFVSPLRRWNQSLRLDLRFLQQSENPIYSNSTIMPMGFSNDVFSNYEPLNRTGVQNLARFSTRYTIPLFYPDNGFFTVPAYLSSIYLTTFTHTLTDMEVNDLVKSSRSIFGAGFHVQFKVSNLLFDLGVGFAYEPTRTNTQFIFGEF